MRAVLLRRLVIMTDTAGLIKGISLYNQEWKVNGWCKANGEPLVDQQAWQDLECVVTELEAVGVEVVFWHIRREHNYGADGLIRSGILQLRRVCAKRQPRSTLLHNRSTCGPARSRVTTSYLP
jgi:ribonuclease HI